MIKIQPAETFTYNGVPYKDWLASKVPTLGASPASCRVQEMSKVTVIGSGGQETKLFVKKVPITIWRSQVEGRDLHTLSFSGNQRMSGTGSIRQMERTS